MGTRIRLSFYGDVQLDRTLVRFSDRAQDATELWEELADRFAAMERRQFASQGRYSGGWPELSDAYAKRKARLYPGAKILHATGELEESLTERPFGVEEITEDHLVVGSAVPHGLYHQRGDGVPRRRPVEFPESERREWVRLIQRHIVGQS